MATSPAISDSAGWQDYKPQGEDGWQDYAPKTPAATQQPKPEAASGVMGTLGREAGSLGSSLAGIPGGIYHAFADPATQEETAEAGGPQEVSGAKRIGLGIGRLTAQPVLNAAKWYGDAAQGKIPNAYEQALSVSPEAMGQGAASVIGGKLAEMAPRAIAAAPEAVSNALPTAGRLVRVGGKVIKGAAEDIPGVRQATKLKGYWDETAPPPVFSKTRLGPEPAPAGPPPVFSKTRLGPEAPPPEVGTSRGLGGYSAPAPEPAAALSGIPTPPPGPAPVQEPWSTIRAQGLRPGGLRQGPSAAPAAQTGEALGNIPAAPVQAPPPSNFPPPEPTGRFKTPAPPAPNPRADLIDDHGVQQDMRDYLDRQGRDVHRFEPVGQNKGDRIANFKEATGGDKQSAVPAKNLTAAPATPAPSARELMRQSYEKLNDGKPYIPLPTKVIAGGDTFEYRGGQFYKNGALLEKTEDLVDATEALGSVDRAWNPKGRGKLIEGEIAKPSSSSGRPPAATPASSDLTPEWQAELDRVKAKKAKAKR